MSHTERLHLREWRPSDAGFHRELWSERDDRVPPHRRIDADGHPTVAELADAIRADRSSEPSLLVIELSATCEPIGYCGLVTSDPDLDAPELAFEVLQRHQGRGYATEAARAAIDGARAGGYEHLWATVWSWNSASRRVLAKLGFVETGRSVASSQHGESLLAELTL